MSPPTVNPDRNKMCRIANLILIQILVLASAAPSFASTNACSKSDGDNLNSQSASIFSSASGTPDCSKASMTASDDQQSALLELLKTKALQKATMISPDLTLAELQNTQTQVGQMRALMAVRNVDLQFSDPSEALDPEDAPQVEPMFAFQIRQPQGFPQPQDLDKDERKKVIRGLSDQTDALAQDAFAYVVKQRPLLEKDGMNPIVLSTKLGDMRDIASAEARSMAEVGYQNLIVKNPLLLFVSQAHPTIADVKVAKRKMSDANAQSMKALSELKISPPPAETSALSLVLFQPIVAEVMKQNPALCPALNALNKKLETNQNIRSWVNGGLGVAGAGTCAVAAFVSAGTLGPACFLLAASDFAVSTGSAVQTFSEKRLLYSGVLQGANLDQYVTKSDEATSFLISAGLSGAATAFSGAGVALRYAARARAVEDEIRAAQTSLERVSSANDNLPPNPSIPKETAAKNAKAIPATDESTLTPTEREHIFYSKKFTYTPERLTDKLKEMGLSWDQSTHEIISLGSPRTPLARQIDEMRRMGMEFKFNFDEPLESYSVEKIAEDKIRINIHGLSMDSRSIEQMIRDNKDKLPRWIHAQEELKQKRIADINNLKIEHSIENPKSYMFTPKSLDGLTKNDPLYWIKQRSNRWGIKVTVDDKDVARVGGGAHARRDTVVIRQGTFDRIYDSKRTIAHELEHATSWVICKKTGKCGRLIQFMGRDLLGPSAKDKSGQTIDSFHRTYGHRFRADEFEARLYEKRPVNSDDHFEIGKFGRRQISILSNLQNQIANEPIQGLKDKSVFIVTENKGQEITIQFATVGPADGSSTANITKNFASDSDAQTYYLDLLSRRVKFLQIEMDKNGYRY
jgi:hypothetical protein